MEKDTASLHLAQNLLLTGIPRSGTSLVTAMIDGLDDAASLSEPTSHLEAADPKTSNAAAAKNLFRRILSERKLAFAGAPLTDHRNYDGTPITNYINRADGKSHVVRPEMFFKREGLSREFLFCCKHNALYTALLPELVKYTELQFMAIVRNPIDCLFSWNRTPFPISRGRLPAGEPFWDDLYNTGRLFSDKQRRQLAILELFFSRYNQFQDKIHILRYEDVITDPDIICKYLGRRMLRQVDVKRNKSDKLYSEQKEKWMHEIRIYAPSALEFYSL